MSKEMPKKELRIMELLSQKRSANFIVKQLGVPFHEVLDMWRKKAFLVKNDNFDIEYYVRMFKAGKKKVVE